ncbi:MAG: HAMP domain-containing methyl-accepting chemotaxis protein, partial [bacterium]|nr:HAMP domain-containing methyl-accepting chemotaxis protein [bacterium]
MEDQVIAGGSSSLLSRLTGKFGIQGKILLGFTAILALTVMIAAVSLIGQRYSNNTVNQMVNIHDRAALLSMEALTHVGDMYQQDALFRRNFETIGLQVAKDMYIPTYIEATTFAQERITDMGNLVQSKQSQELSQKVLETLNVYSGAFIATINSYDQKYDPDFGALAKIQNTLEAVESTIEGTGIPPEAALLFHHFENEYNQYLINPNSQTVAGTTHAVAEFQERLPGLVQGDQLARLQEQAKLFAQGFDELISADDDINAQTAAYEQIASQVPPILIAMRDDALANQGQFAERLTGISKTVLYTVLGASLFALLLGLLLAWVISSGLTRQVDRIMDLLGELGIGNFNARTEVTSQDELGVMATSLNAMLDNITMLIQSQEEQDKVQESFMKLMMELGELTEGNLTARAEVTEDITGAIADSFNTMAEQFGGIVRQVKGATNAVDETAADVSKLTSDLAVRSLEQNKQVNEAIGSIQSIAESIREVSQNAARSADVSMASRMNAREGAEAVEQTNRAMDEIREQINETARSIKRLGESSMEIGNVVEIINNIADRTSILALNASIQAAMAGEAGHGFAVVAEEVQRLAESSSSSTKQIETLIKSIQAEIKDAGNRMDESISKVVQGSQLADGAYAKLQEIETVS